MGAQIGILDENDPRVLELRIRVAATKKAQAEKELKEALDAKAAVEFKREPFHGEHIFKIRKRKSR